MTNQQQSPVQVDCTRIRCKPPIFLRSREQCNNIHCDSRSLLSSRLSRYPYAAVDKWQLVVSICSIRVSLEVLLLDRVVLLRLQSVTLVLAPRLLLLSSTLPLNTDSRDASRQCLTTAWRGRCFLPQFIYKIALQKLIPFLSSRFKLMQFSSSNLYFCLQC